MPWLPSFWGDQLGVDSEQWPQASGEDREIPYTYEAGVSQGPDPVPDS